MIEVDLKYAKEHLEELIDDEIVIINTKKKKLVLLPYEEYNKKSFDRFVGVLDKMDINDERYKRILE